MVKWCWGKPPPSPSLDVLGLCAALLIAEKPRHYRTANSKALMFHEDSNIRKHQAICITPITPVTKPVLRAKLLILLVITPVTPITPQKQPRRGEGQVLTAAMPLSTGAISRRRRATIGHTFEAWPCLGFLVHNSGPRPRRWLVCRWKREGSTSVTPAAPDQATRPSATGLPGTRSVRSHP